MAARLAPAVSVWARELSPPLPHALSFPYVRRALLSFLCWGGGGRWGLASALPCVSSFTWPPYKALPLFPLIPGHSPGD